MSDFIGNTEAGIDILSERTVNVIKGTKFGIDFESGMPRNKTSRLW